MKLSALFLSLLISLTSLHCSGDPVLTFMAGGAPNEIAYWESVVETFEEETGIAVRLIRQTTDTDQRKQSIILALRGRRSDPDVMLVDVAWIGQLAASGWLMPLNDYNIDTQPFFSPVISLANTYEESLIGLPLYVDGGLLYYRKDLLEKYGYDSPPQTWEQLLEMAKTVQNGEREHNSDFWGYVWQGAQYEGLICNALETFVSAGGGILDSHGNSITSTEENVKALEFMISLIHEHAVSPPNTFTDMKEEEVRMTFQAGNTLFQRNWPYAWGLHNAKDSEIKGKVAIAPLPSFPEHQSAATLGGWHAVVSAYSDMPEEAVQFLQYITSYDVQKDMTLNLGWNPGRSDLYENETIQSSAPHLVELKPVFEGAVPRPVVPYYSEISQILQKQINAALAGQVSAAQALENADKGIVNLITTHENAQ
ncbi:ABC transporter substrate-binding protein [Chitinispirillales bacterium ANBcel5]|uniref:ABC transporter substrate-binding protein n=1 Tax=Cellulosispirillum alkaliphilum TaxID=3039283 RepID=UPI002A509E63|nr:ABC transporter substrate-binding protein [Chitinispirillales bacterium ANBcel5]